MTGFSLSDLEAIIDARANSDDLSSWTATLVSQGINKASEKLGEEAIESVVAAVAGSQDDLRNETADLLYHLLVVLHIRGLSLQEVMQELEVRSGQSGIAEKQSRSGSDNSE